MKVIIKNDSKCGSLWAAHYIAEKINAKAAKSDKPFVLGLCTGSTPIETYAEWGRMVKAGEVSFKNVITFNMDEYCNLPEEHPESYHSFMWNTFFKHIDINPENVNILNGNAEDIEAECANYEARIKAAGGVDLFMGGVGPDGHIAFNEPTASLYSRTHEQALTEETILANCRFFDNDMTKVPKTALTVGVGTILDAKSVMIVANGYGKTRALKDAIEGGVSQMCPLSALQLHPNAMFIVDETAVSELKVSTYRFFKDVERNNIDPESIKI